MASFTKILAHNKHLLVIQNAFLIYNRSISLITKFKSWTGFRPSWCHYSRMRLQTKRAVLPQFGDGGQPGWRLKCTAGPIEGAPLEVESPLVTESPGRTVALSKREQQRLLRSKPKMPPDPHTVKVAVIGAPNAGKSTLFNQLLGWRVAAVSEKVHTTRRSTLGVLTEDNVQVIFLDTPGLVDSSTVNRHKLERSLLVDPHQTLFKADIIVVLIDVSNVWGRQKLPEDILRLLHLHANKTSVLVLNKVDLLASKQMLLKATRLLTEGIVGGKRHSQVIGPTTQNLDAARLLDKLEPQKEDDEDYGEMKDEKQFPEPQIQETTGLAPGDISASAFTTLEDQAAWNEYRLILWRITGQLRHEDRKGWPHFSHVFMVSAKAGDGIWDLKQYLLRCAKPGDWEFAGALVTNQSPIAMACQCVWEKCMDQLPHEVPYQIRVKPIVWTVDEDGMLRTAFDIICTRKRQMIHAIGKDGSTVKMIASEAKQALMNTFRRELSLKLYVKMKTE